MNKTRPPLGVECLLGNWTIATVWKIATADGCIASYQLNHKQDMRGQHMKKAGGK